MTALMPSRSRGEEGFKVVVISAPPSPHRARYTDMKEQLKIPINIDGGCAKTIVAGYYKFGVATLLGDTFGTSGTAILEIYEEDTPA